MSSAITQEILNEVVSNICYEGEVVSILPYGNGHINDTYCLVTKLGNGEQKRYILQRMNRNIFKNPVELMENVSNVTAYVRKQIEKNGGDPQRETLNIVPTKDGKQYYLDSTGEYWRVYHFIENAICLDAAEKPEDFYESAVAFGQFQKLLADYPAHTLHEIIPNFHNTVDRFANLEKAIQEDVCGRAKDVQEEIAFAMARKADAAVCVDMQKAGKLPLRVTHNDTKLNNVMLDSTTRKGLCVIDLDTVMPGLAINDFGDSIRFGASTASEDETDLSKVSMDLNLFETYAKGFLKACGDSLTEEEIKMMPMGAKLMTFECGMRFLTDYLQGDTYFKTHRPGHNLDRCHTQFKLVKDMEDKWEQMAAIIEKLKA